MQANEAAFYDREFFNTVGDVGPWYKFSIPYLRTVLAPSMKLVELGFGQGHLLRSLVQEELILEENVYGIDQSRTAVDYVKQFLPKAHLGIGDIYRLEYPKDFFDVCMLMETIEHLEEPAPALEQIYSVISHNGQLLVSFPNYLSLPWLFVRWLVDLGIGKTSWICRQPIDKIYTVFHVIKLVEKAGFRFEKGIGSGYGPPELYKLETEWLTRALNALRLWRLSFHPILVFRKPPVGHSP